MKLNLRYWLFSGNHHRRGGLFDLQGSFTSVSQCINHLIEKAPEGRSCWWHVFDSQSQQIILANDALEVNGNLTLEYDGN